MSDEWNKEMENTPSQPGEGDATPFEKPVQQESDTAGTPAAEEPAVAQAEAVCEDISSTSQEQTTRMGSEPRQGAETEPSVNQQSAPNYNYTQNVPPVQQNYGNSMPGYPPQGPVVYWGGIRYEWNGQAYQPISQQTYQAQPPVYRPAQQNYGYPPQAPVPPHGAPVQQPGYPVAPNQYQPVPSQREAVQTTGQVPPVTGDVPPMPPATGDIPAGVPGGPKKKKGPKVYVIVIIVLAALLVVGFCGYGIYAALQQGNDPQMPSSSQGESSEPGQPNNSEPDSRPDDGTNSSQAPQQGQVDPNATMKLEDFPTSQEEKTAKEVYSQVAPSVVLVTNTYATGDKVGYGSGVILTADGYIVTNSHVIGDSDKNSLKVTLQDGTEYDAAVVGYDQATDLAVLKINESGLQAATFGNSDQLEIGDQVVAIGNPRGVSSISSMTQGYVSGLGITSPSVLEENMTYIQTDAAINPGNSGGALVNMYGQVVGITTAKMNTTAGYEGMGFSIPTAKAQAIVEELVQKGFVSSRPRLGIQATDISTSQQSMGLPAGVLIVSIDANSSFSGTIAQQGDIITAVDGTRIYGMDNLSQMLAKYKAGDTVKLTLARVDNMGNISELEVSVTLLERTS